MSESRPREIAAEDPTARRNGKVGSRDPFEAIEEALGEFPALTS